MADEAPQVSNSAPPFLTKTYEMVDDPSTNPVVSWSHHGKTFIVWNPTEFSRLLLPIFFKHSNFSSFIRQLNTYGFRKVHPEQWEFANECFVRDQPDLIRNIYRRKPVYSHSGPNPTTLPRLTKHERKGYKDDIKKLKYDKESLAAEMERFKEEEQGLRVKIRALTESVKNVETQHVNILSSLAHTLRRMEEAQSRKRRFSGRSSCSFEETSLSEIPNALGNLDNDTLLSFNRELLEKLESSLTFWEKIVFDGFVLPNSSSLELVESGIGVRFSEIDMNSEPRSGGVSEVKLQQTHAKEKNVGAAADRRTGINDVFWEQLLTENPRLNSDSPVTKKNETKWTIQGNIGGI